MQTNITTVDRYLRLCTGLLLYGSATQLRRPSLAKGALAAMGAMKIAEGVTGWCPMTHLLTRTSVGAQQSAERMSPETSRQDARSQRDHPESVARGARASEWRPPARDLDQTPRPQ